MNLSLSFIKGLVAAVNPCGFVLLPTYLLYFLGLSAQAGERQKAPISRALVVSASVSAGFLGVFLAIGIVTQFFTDWLISNAKYATAIIGATFVVLGVAMLFGYKLPISTPSLDAGHRDRTTRSMFVYGIAYAVASLGCTLPVFTTTLFGTAHRNGYAAGVANVVAYGVGMAMLVTALTVALAAANAGLLRFLRSSLKYVEMVSGAFVLLSGAYLLWYFWWVDVKDTSDPLTDAAGRAQTRVQNFVNDHWQAVGLVGVLVVGAAVVSATAHRHARHPGTE
jgi:cytochrome c biogenesis protein CcdA